MSEILTEASEHRLRRAILAGTVAASVLLTGSCKAQDPSDLTCGNSLRHTEVNAGDTVWGFASDIVGGQASPELRNAVEHRILDLNKMASGYDLQLGTFIVLPQTGSCHF